MDKDVELNKHCRFERNEATAAIDESSHDDENVVAQNSEAREGINLDSDLETHYLLDAKLFERVQPTTYRFSQNAILAF